MAPRRRATHVARLILALIIVTVSVASVVMAEPQEPLANFTLSKDATPETGVDVGEEVMIILTAKNRWDQDATVTVKDVNPNPAWFEIVQGSLTGDAVYVPAAPSAPESVVWNGEIRMNRSHIITFKMKVIGGAGQKETNVANLTLEGSAGTLPDAPEADAEILIKPAAPELEPIDNDDGDGSYLVAWSEVTGAVAYGLEEDESSDFDSPVSAYTGTNSQVLLQNRGPGTWYYRVVAIGGNSTVSQPSNTESATVVMGIPQLYDIANPDSEPDYLVEWSEVTGATSYTLQEDSDAGFGSPTTRYLGPNEAYQVEDQPDGTWHYRVQANGPGGISSDWSLPKSSRVGGGIARIAFLPLAIRIWPPVPETPTLRSISNPDGVGDYTVNWSTAARAKTYVLEEAGASSFQGAKEIYVGEDTTYPIDERGASRLFYRVKARNPSGESKWSNVQKVDVLWENEPNDSASQANGPIVSGLTYFGSFPQGASDVSDYYYFDLPVGRAVEIRLTDIPEGQDYNLILRDTALNTKGYSAQPDNKDEYINVWVPAGRYFIQVYHFSGGGSSQAYHLRALYE